MDRYVCVKDFDLPRYDENDCPTEDYMRETLFKAKSLNDGQWIEGYAFRCWKRAYILYGMTNGAPNMIEVNPETVCQYTGLTDRNGQKIWENDFVGFEDMYSTENGYAESSCCGVVVWDNETLSFEVTERLSAESYEVLGDCVVVGNTIDNPELLTN